MRVKKDKKDIKEKILLYTDKIRSSLSGYFVAEGIDNIEVRKKHKRVGKAIFLGIGGLLIGSFFLSVAVDKGVFTREEKQAVAVDNTSRKVDIKNLSNGATHEESWLERSEKDLLDLKMQQKSVEEKHNKLGEYLSKESVSKKDLANILKEFEKEIFKKYEDKLLEQQRMSTGGAGTQQLQGNPIEVMVNKPKKLVKKIGTYIPAGSYVEAKMISGIDAGIGITAEANPRQVLLRIVGKAISAGFGKNYLTTSKLMGCIVQCQAVGDLSSEKAYFKPVLMTCAASRDSVIEIPVKGYVTSNGKVGIRGEIIEKSGDLVTKSFLAGLVGGLGGGASRALEPGFALSSGGFAVKESGTEIAKNIFGSGLGKGLSDSSNRLSDYLIKRAEQYQPIISINEGVGVDLVFQEGFSLREEENV